MKRLPFFLISFLIVFGSCKPVTIMRLIQTDEAKAFQFKNNIKQVVYIPMHHIGKPQFYEGVKTLVDSFKKNGFIVFYESARIENVTDSVTLDRYNRKFRKMMGVHLDSTGYAKYFHESGLFRQLVDQPRYDKLGVDSSDIRIDIPKNKLVDLYERKFGEIELEKGDWIPLDEKYNLELRLPQKEVMQILLDERNKNLAIAIHYSDFKRIVVVYGAAHMSGMLKELQKIDNSWSRN